MNILAFEPFAQREGHFGIYASQVCQELSLLGHQVTLVTTRLEADRYLSSSPKFQIVETLRNPGVDSGGRASFLKSALRGVSIILDNVRVLMKILGLYRKKKFDLVHFFDTEPISTVLILAFCSVFVGLRLTPLYVVLHAPDATPQAHGNLLYTLYAKMSRPMFRRLLAGYADVITAHGSWPNGELEQALNIPDHGRKIRFVPYGTILPEAPPSKEEARSQLGLPNDQTLLMFFGMLRKDKGVERLIEAMGRIQGNLRLLLVGTPFDWSKEEILEMIRTHGAEKKIETVLQYIPEREIPNYFAAADALILPYRKEYIGAAGPLKTALAFGLPVIATRVRELDEYMKKGKIGVAAEDDRAESIKEAIERFLAIGAAGRREMEDNGRRLAKGCSWTVVAEQFSEIYSSHVNPGGIKA